MRNKRPFRYNQTNYYSLSKIIYKFVSFLESINTNNYTYTIGSDRENTFLFCNTNDTSIQLSNIYWRRKDVIGFYSNPLDVYSLRNILIGTNDHIMECYDFESDNNILNVGLFIQGKIAKSNYILTTMLSLPSNRSTFDNIESCIQQLFLSPCSRY